MRETDPGFREAFPVDLGRRSFLRAALGACAMMLAWPAQARARPLNPLRLAALLPDTGNGAGNGVTLGMEEAVRTGALMGRAVEMERLTGVSDAGAWARGAGATALIGGTDEASAGELGELARSAAILFVNVAAREDRLRRCPGSTFHVQASDAMYRDAAAASAESAAATPVLWWSGLERFGAAQLNDRYRARFGSAMDGPAWAGWMAVKVLWEASLRAAAADASSMRAYLRREGTRFDGHKGWPLSFRPWDGQLRQPLYLVSGDRLGAEVPARAAPEASSQELLDQLGARAGSDPCPETAR
jgi:ABC-type branched-subunit amino acid transport system substrate-binding protein